MLRALSRLANLPAIAKPPEPLELQTDKPVALSKKLDKGNVSLFHNLVFHLILSSQPRSPKPYLRQHLRLLRQKRSTSLPSIHPLTHCYPLTH